MRQPVNLVISERDGFAESVLGRSGLAFQPFPDHLDGGFGCVLSRGVAAHAVDHRIDSPLRIDVQAVFIVTAPTAHVRAGRMTQTCPHRHQRLSRAIAISAISATVTSSATRTTVRPISRSFTAIVPMRFPLG